MANASLQKRSFGTTSGGAGVDEFTLTNASGMEVKIITYGGIITSIRVPDRQGNFANVVLGLATMQDYETGNGPYLGSLIGRFGNRITNSKFTLEGVSYSLAANDHANSLHGGLKGFDKRVWTAKEVQNGDEVGVELSYLSPDGEEGYPGNLSSTVVYTLTADNALRIQYSATTDKTTIVNLTNHSYFNLDGNGAGSVDGHIMQINADAFTPLDDKANLTGEIASVAGTPFDFRSPRQIGPGLRSGYPQVVIGRGYDHNFVLNRSEGNGLEFAARAYAPSSGRALEVWTTEPGVQFYTGNFLDGTLVGSHGGLYRQGDALCLETQHYPDSPNQPHFPTTTLKPGETYQSTTVFKFTTD